MQNGKKAANGCVIAPATRFILSLLISPDGVIIPLSKSTLFMSSSFIFVVLKWCPVLQNHLVRRYGKINEDMQKTLILSHFLMVS